jgi:short-subunit dehydrogenase
VAWDESIGRKPMTQAALITGGAGAIAGALATRLAARGYRLILIDMDEAGLRAAASRIAGGADTHRADLTNADDLDRVARLVSDTPDLTLLVNNAGVIRPGDVAALPFADIAVQIDVNLRAPIRLIHAAATRFKAAGGGCILSIVSAAAFASLPGSAAYSAAKFGLRGLQISLHQELAPHGVRVRGVFPGAVDTPMLRYEATHGGSPLNFLNKDVLRVDDVAEACLRAMDGSRLETLLPGSDGFLLRLVSACPAVMAALMPRLERAGRRGMDRYVKSRGLAAE